MIWPLPALLSWAACWALFAALRWTEAPTWIALAVAAGVGAALSVLGATPWRRVFIAMGFPLSLAASGAAGALPAWAWLLPLALLLLMYPLHAWRDAPLFPTPTGALQGLSKLAPLKESAQVLDAGCGLGAGLRELHREYPGARLAGLEWSWPLRMLCALRCRYAHVKRADIWAVDWSAHDMVYLFQRPESMPRAVAKAAQELRPGAFMASLEFEAATLRPHGVLDGADGRKVWVYRVPFVPVA